MIPDFGLTKLWNGLGVLLPLAVFALGAIVLDQFRPSFFDGLYAFAWYGAFAVVALWTLYFMTGQHQKPSS